MLESIARQGQCNHYSKRSLQGAGSRHSTVRSVFMFSAAFALLTASSPQSDAEESQKTSTELGQSDQTETVGQNQAAANKAVKRKPKCMPKQPCPDTAAPQ